MVVTRDPLFSYLFLRVFKGLLAFIFRACCEAKLHWFKISHAALVLSSLFFIDDSLFFFHDNEAKVKNLKKVLNIMDHTWANK